MTINEISRPLRAPSKEVFTYDLVPFQQREHLLRFADTDNPPQNYFIRDLGWRLEMLDKPEQSIREISDKTVALLSDIQLYGIQVPPFYLQEGLNDNNEPALYLMTRDLGTSVGMADVNYTQLSDVQKDLYVQRFNSLMIGLTSYYGACIKDDRDFMSDLAKTEQYVYAPNPPSLDPDFVLVDLEPLTASPHDLEAIDAIVSRLGSIIGGLMQKDKQRDLSPSRHALAAFIDTVLAEHIPQDEAEMGILYSLADMRQAISY